MPASLRSLLLEPSFRLRLLAGASDDALDAPLTWAHSSDLVDPTPWLEPGQLLLTDGVHFEPDAPDAFSDPYVARLRAAGIRGLGFATEIVHERVPESLLRACDRHGLPLLEVADRTPFMGLIRHVADVISRERQERLEWSLRAQRAVARAALRPDGLGAILAELEKQLGCWVALFDSVGARVRVGSAIELPADQAASVQEAVRAALARGTRAGVRLSADGGGVTLQTLGQRDRLRGVLAVGAAVPLDLAGTELVESVIALASIALEQSSTLESARRQLRTGLLELLLSGVIDVAGRAARRLWGPLPADPVRVTVLGARSQALLDELERQADESGALFFADHDGEIVAITSHDDTERLEAVLRRHDAVAGVSAPTIWPRLAEGLTEARRAAARASATQRVVRYDAVAEQGMLGLLEGAGAGAMARRVLHPLLEREDGALLAATARVWLEHNAAWDPAARELGVHRHTLRNRVTLVQQILGLDLDRFADRAELWSALHFAG